jgi:hypothetical protein
MTFFQQGSGLPHKELKASNAQGEFRVDLGTGRHPARLRVGESEFKGSKTYQISGTPDDARRVLEGLARDGSISAEQIDEIVESGRVDAAKSENLTMTISLDLVLVRRLLAKISLCVLTYLQGDVFIATSMAEWLRQVLDAPRHWGMGLAKKSNQTRLESAQSMPSIRTGSLARSGPCVMASMKMGRTIQQMMYVS